MTLKVAKFCDLKYEIGDLSSGRIFVCGTVDGFQREFFLDSGSTDTLISNSENFKGKPIVETSPFHSASGSSININYIKSEEVIVGPFIAENLKVGLLEKASNEPSKLGLSFLKQHLMSFDFPNKKIYSPNRFLADMNFEYSKKGHIQLIANLASQDIACIFDSGAGLSVIDKEFVDSNPQHFQLLDSNGTVGDGNNIEMKANIFNISHLKVGEHSFSDTKIVSVDLREFKKVLGVKKLMILGFNHLVEHSWIFDFDNQKYSIC